MSAQLAVYDHAREALAAAVRFDEVTQLHTDALKAEAYARIAKDRKLQADAAEIVARAERKLGIMLRKAKGEGQLSQGGRPSTSNLDESETGEDGEPVFDSTTFTLADIGVDKKLSSRAQKAAALDDAAFEEAVEVRRGKILSADAPVVSAPKPKVVKAAKPEPIKALEPRRWHQFCFSVIALTMASDRISSEAVHKLAEHCGIVWLDGDVLDFMPEAIEAMGSLATAALKAIGDDSFTDNRVPPNEANKTAGGFPVAAAPVKAEQQGVGEATREAKSETSTMMDVTAGETASDLLAKAQLREAYEGEVALLAPQKGKLSMQQAAAAMRAGYAAEVPLLLMVEDLGHPHGTIATWANRLGLTKTSRMHSTQKRFGGDA